MAEENTSSQLQEVIDTLDMLLEDIPLKAKDSLTQIIKTLKSSPKVDDLMKIQDELESVSNFPNVDYYSRNEIMNVIALIESIINE